VVVTSCKQRQDLARIGLLESSRENLSASKKRMEGGAGGEEKDTDSLREEYDKTRAQLASSS